MSDGSAGAGQPSPASLRWGILRRALLSSRLHSPNALAGVNLDLISRKSIRGFRLIPWEYVNGHCSIEDRGAAKDAYLCYHLPTEENPKLFLVQKQENGLDLNDIEDSFRQNIDRTGLVCQWPAEDVLAYYCLNHANIFRSKRVLELGAGYGLAGLAIAAGTDALEVVLSDGNDQVVDYIQRNIYANEKLFGDTKVLSLALRWDETEAADVGKVLTLLLLVTAHFSRNLMKALLILSRLY